MANCTDNLKKYLDKIKLSTAKMDSLRKSRDAVRTRIENFFTNKELSIPNFNGQGSFTMKTMNYQSGENYDIDDGVYLTHLDTDKNNWPTTETIHKLIFDAVDDHTNEKTVDKKSCVRVQYKSEYHIDLPIYASFNGTHYLAKKGDIQWEKNDSKGFTQWFRNHISEYGEQFRNIVFYIKGWNTFKGIPNLTGFIITILIGNNFVSGYERDDECLYYTLKNICQDLSYHRSVIVPVEPHTDKLSSLPSNQIDNLIERFEDFRDKAGDAIDEDDENKADKIWFKLFGYQYPYSKTESNSATHSFVYTGKSKTQPWGIG